MKGQRQSQAAAKREWLARWKQLRQQQKELERAPAFGAGVQADAGQVRGLELRLVAPRP